MATILLVDDSTFARNFVKRILGDQYTYAEASNGNDGLKAYSVHHPDLVILDVTMPDISGLEVLEQLRKQDAHAQVVVCSADIQDYNRNRAMELGARAFLNKPVNSGALLDAIRSILSESGA